MSIHLTAASAQRLNAKTNPLYNAAYGIGGWVRMASLPATSTLFAVDDGTTANFDRLAYQSSTPGWTVRTALASVVQDKGVGVPVIGEWWYVAMTRNSATLMEIFSGKTPATITSGGTTTAQDVTARTAGTEITFGDTAGTGANTCDGDLMGWKWFNTNLLLADWKAEAAQLSPVLTGNIKFWWPLINLNGYTLSNPAGLTLAPTGTPTLGSEHAPFASWEFNSPASLDPRYAPPTRRVAGTLRQF